jgi:hypothetical protein
MLVCCKLREMEQMRYIGSLWSSFGRSFLDMARDFDLWWIVSIIRCDQKSTKKKYDTDINGNSY